MENNNVVNDLNSLRIAVRKASNEWEYRFVYNGSHRSKEANREYVEYLIRIAYLSILAFLDSHRFLELSNYLKTRWEKDHESNLLNSFLSDYAEEPMLHVVSTFWEIIEAISNIVTNKDNGHGQVDKNNVNIVSIIKGMPEAALKLNLNIVKESDLDTLAEAILLPLFPDLNSNPSLGLRESYRLPDSAIPSIHTLLEYKFISNKADIKKIIDVIQADIRNYAQEPWKNLIFVVGQNDPYTNDERLSATILKEPSTFKIIDCKVVNFSRRA